VAKPNLISADTPPPPPAEVERIIARLEPLLLERRLARMQTVLNARTDHIAFVFERMTDPHNLSAALRSLDAFGFQENWWIQAGERLELSHLITRGTHRWLSLHGAESTEVCFAALKAQGYRVLASHLGGQQCVPLAEIDFSQRTALVFGNEHAGVSDEALAHADGRFRIDMLGFTESLNLSVATAITAFHARRELDRMRQSAVDPDAFRLTPAKRRALYAQWLMESVRRVEDVLAGDATPMPRSQGEGE